jgi:Xaa-Pro aminopeptidase
VDGFLVTNPVNVTYLTGFSGDSSYLLVGRKENLLVSDGRYAIQLQEECPGLPVHLRPPSVRITPAAAEQLRKLGWRTISCDASHLTLAEFEILRGEVKDAQWRAAVGAVEQFRVKKDEHEIAALREAIGMAERALEQFKASLGPEDTEKELHDRMELLVRAEGAKCTSFPTIVAVGPRSALPHAPPTKVPLAETDVLLVDWGANGGFYRSDLTRTFAPRAISPKFRQVYSAVFEAQRRAIAALRPGVKAEDVDAAARSALTEAGLNQFFNHGTGHGIGLDVHEAPALRPASDTVLEPGMVVTIEPGVYLAEWGGVRIEDDVLITPEGAEVLTTTPKTLEEMVLAL